MTNQTVSERSFAKEVELDTKGDAFNERIWVGL